MSLSLAVVDWVLDMTASILAHRPDAGASTAYSPAERPGEGDDGGCCRHVRVACTLCLATKSSQSSSLAARAGFVEKQA